MATITIGHDKNVDWDVGALTDQAIGADATTGRLVLKNYVVTKTYTGSDQTFTVPTGITKIHVKMWGAGGGGGYHGGWSWGYPGGGGGYSEGDIDVTGISSLVVMVGQGGDKGQTSNSTMMYGGGGRNCGGTDCQYGAKGGGRSAVRYNGEDILTAGGGGGGGCRSSAPTTDNSGGGGGGTTGQDGVYAGNRTGTYAGRGGTQSAGGISPSGNVGVTNGAKYTGGYHNTHSYGGGGGGGWYGGGCGNYLNGDGMGGGGGGSSYIAHALISNGLTYSGDGSTPGNTYDSDRNGAGLGGAENTDGASGRVIISYYFVVGTHSMIIDIGVDNSPMELSWDSIEDSATSNRANEVNTNADANPKTISIRGSDTAPSGTAAGSFNDSNGSSHDYWTAWGTTTPSEWEEVTNGSGIVNKYRYMEIRDTLRANL